MRESRPSGSVRGAPSNGRPYRDHRYETRYAHDPLWMAAPLRRRDKRCARRSAQMEISPGLSWMK